MFKRSEQQPQTDVPWSARHCGRKAQRADAKSSADAPWPGDATCGTNRTAFTGVALSRRAMHALLLGCMGLAAAGSRTAAAAAADAASFYSNFNGMKLTDQDGRPLAWRAMQGRFVLVNFVFTGCSTVCPIQTRALLDMHQRLPTGLRPKVRLLSVSLDPLSDSPEVLKAFARRMGADMPAWRFATGRPEDIERLADKLRLFKPGPDTRKPDDHSTALWLVDPAGQLRFRYSGNPPDTERLVREIAVLDQMRPAQQG
jgi:cytochrome oxidase Cu insertion factor (SCO1/SenC/PrrC family)